VNESIGRLHDGLDLTSKDILSQLAAAMLNLELDLNVFLDAIIHHEDSQVRS
jgi:hypothetical protein